MLVKMYKSKTIWFSILLAALGAMQVNLPVVQSFINPEWYGWSTVAIAICVAILRAITTEPLSAK